MLNKRNKGYIVGNFMKLVVARTAAFIRQDSN